MTLDEVATELRPIISEFCQTDGNDWIVQKRLQREWQYCIDAAKRRSEAARAREQNKKEASPRAAPNLTSPSDEKIHEAYTPARESVPTPEGKRPLISPEASAFADELAAIAGHDPSFPPPLWISAQPHMRVQMMLDAGWRVDAMRAAAKAAMRSRRKTDPIGTIRYFEKIFAQANAPPLPLPAAQIVSTEKGHAQEHASSRTADWRSRRDGGHAALAQLHASVDADNAADQGGEGRSGAPLRLVSDGGRRR
jgi:hypothetical protein